MALDMPSVAARTAAREPLDSFYVSTVSLSALAKLPVNLDGNGSKKCFTVNVPAVYT